MAVAPAFSESFENYFSPVLYECVTLSYTLDSHPQLGQRVCH